MQTLVRRQYRSYSLEIYDDDEELSRSTRNDASRRPTTSRLRTGDDSRTSQTNHPASSSATRHPTEKKIIPPCLLLSVAQSRSLHSEVPNFRYVYLPSARLPRRATADRCCAGFAAVGHRPQHEYKSIWYVLSSLHIYSARFYAFLQDPSSALTLAQQIHVSP